VNIFLRECYTLRRGVKQWKGENGKQMRNGVIETKNGDEVKRDRRCLKNFN